MWAKPSERLREGHLKDPAIVTVRHHYNEVGLERGLPGMEHINENQLTSLKIIRSLDLLTLTRKIDCKAEFKDAPLTSCGLRKVGPRQMYENVARRSDIRLDSN